MSDETVAFVSSLKKDINWKKFVAKLIIKSVLNTIVKLFIAKLLIDKIKT